MVWRERDFKDHLVPTPCHRQGHQKLVKRISLSMNVWLGFVLFSPAFSLHSSRSAVSMSNVQRRDRILLQLLSDLNGLSHFTYKYLSCLFPQFLIQQQNNALKKKGKPKTHMEKNGCIRGMEIIYSYTCKTTLSKIYVCDKTLQEISFYNSTHLER